LEKESSKGEIERVLCFAISPEPSAHTSTPAGAKKKEEENKIASEVVYTHS